MLVCVGCGKSKIDAVTVPAKPADVTEPDSEISNSALTIHPITLRSVYTWINDHKILKQYMTMLISMCQLKSSRSIRVN